MSEQDTVDKLDGIGQKRAERLRTYKVFTVGDLVNNASRLPDEFAKYVSIAKDYLGQSNSSLRSAAPTKLAPEEQEQDLYCIEHHSWWELRVRVPILSKSITVEGVVHELTMLPGQNWIGIVCEFDHTACSISPSVLLHYNPHLPAFMIHLSEQDVETFPCYRALKRMMYELNCMKTIE
jgi:hypothetical protein